MHVSQTRGHLGLICIYRYRWGSDNKPKRVQAVNKAYLWTNERLQYRAILKNYSGWSMSEDDHLYAF